MKLEEVNNKTKEAVDFLVQSLESGHSEVLTAVSRSNGQVSHLQLRQHHADCEAETRCDQRCRTSDMELAWPLR